MEANTAAAPLPSTRQYAVAVIRACARFLLRLRQPFLRHRIRQPVLESIEGIPFLLTPEVQNPVVFRSGAWFGRTLARCERPPLGARALDLGTGSGVCAVFAARIGYQVIAVDINPEAVRCAQTNVLLNRLEGRIEVRHGDLFSSVQDELFDLVLFNPPFFRGEPGKHEARGREPVGEPKSFQCDRAAIEALFDLSWRSQDIGERFAANLQSRLKGGGRALVLLSTDGDAQGMLAALGQHGFQVDPFARRNFINEIMTIYSVRMAQAQA
jgi:methylase of polypeptide subunit release factors